MVKKILTKEEKEDKAIIDIVKFAKEHRATLKTVEKLKEELIGIQELDKKLDSYIDYICLCESMLRKEDGYLKQIATELNIRLDNRRE